MTAIKIRDRVQRFMAQSRAVTAIEYALLASLVALTIVAGATVAGNGVGTTFNSVSSTLSAGASGGTSSAATSGSSSSGSSSSGSSSSGSTSGGGDHRGDPDHWYF